MNYYGKETIDTNTFGKSSGHGGSYSTNYQQTGRELLTPDEVRLLDNNYALLFIRGERAIKDFKYDILKHPNIELTADGKASLYEHGKTENSFLNIEVIRTRTLKTNEEEENNDFENKYEIVYSSQIEGYLMHEREKEEKEKLEKEKEIIENEESNENE